MLTRKDNVICFNWRIVTYISLRNFVAYFVFPKMNENIIATNGLPGSAVAVAKVYGYRWLQFLPVLRDLYD